MDRREMFQLLGAAGIASTASLGCSCTGVFAQEHGHGHDATPDKAMLPVKNIHLHFCGIHVAKNNPKFQIITQHYCSPVNDEVHQCLLYESGEKNAKLLGVEYLISDRMFRELPDAEKKYWHPHTYEVLGGGLIAPEMTSEDEMKFMKYILTTWGKTWHTWPDPKTAAPMGDPLLMWSLMGDDQVDPAVIAERDRQFNVSAAKLRETRVKEIGFEPPNVPFPKSMDQVGRQWKVSGEDKPTKLP